MDTQRTPNLAPFHQLTSPRVCVLILVLFACASIIPSVSSSCVFTPAPQEHLETLATALNEFAIKLYKRMTRNSDENVFFSPLSVSAAFQMIFYGTRGDTAEELRTVLGYKQSALPNDVIHITFHHLLCKLQLASNSSQDPAIVIANALLVDADLAMHPAYRTAVEDLYQAEVQNVKFAVDSMAIAQDVNSWVSEKTNGMIGMLVDRLDSTSVLVVLNAVYFKGIWRFPFDVGRTKNKIFLNGGLLSNAVEVPTMSTRHQLRLGQSETFQALELPYTGGSMSMLILLPLEQNGLQEVEQELTVELLNELLNTMVEHDVIVTLPKFKFEYARELSEDMQGLGAFKIFDYDSADFSGMTPSMNAYVTSALHRAVIEVSEAGTEAATGTGISVTGRSAPFFFSADHPFLFAIVYKTGDRSVVLLMGRITHF